MSLLGILNTAQTGLIAQKAAIQVTSENIANMATPGYSKQTPIFETAQTTLENGFPLGSGVEISKVQRNYDDLLQTLLKKENSNNGQSSTEQTNMLRIQQLFPDLTGDGLGTSLQNYFNAWQDLSVNPQGTPERQAVLSSGNLLADNFKQINTYLTDLKTQANMSLTSLTSDINDKLKNIASLNAEIQQTEMVSGNANELRDQRDLMVLDLAKKVGINYKEETNGNLTVTLTSGESLVSGNKAGTFSLQENSGKYDINLTQAGSSTTALVDLSNGKGEIGGALMVRDTTVDSYLSKLDELAYTLANQVNAVHSTGYGLDNSTGNDFFTAPVTMAGYSSLISVAIGTTDQVAAADTDLSSASSGTGNNSNALNLAGLKNATISTSTGNITLPGFYNALVSSVGVGVQDAERATKLSNSVLAQMNNLRESQSGVSLDEEMTNLIKYQKAFEGAAKVINTATEMMDTVLGLVR
jgi:flagellar hook-associated protein 1 FlgK